MKCSNAEREFMVESTFLKTINHLGPVVCFGGANLDFKARGVHSLTLRDSNPVRIYSTFGGVARNIAENLARLGASVRLISRVGSDSAGDSLLEAMSQLGVEVSGVSRSNRCPTATYTAVLEPEGEMLIGLANMDIYDELTSDVLLSQGIPTQGSFWVVDSNLPESTLQ